MSKSVIYEHPMKERTRLLLRLLHLLDKFSFYHSRNNRWDSRSAVGVLVDISTILARTDIKKEVISELERHFSRLESLNSLPNVDGRRLESVMKALKESVNEMRATSTGPLGNDLRNHEFLKLVMQRSTIPGGTCNFDMPLYHYWLEMPSEQRVQQLKQWFHSLEPLKKAVSLIVDLIRTSSTPHQKIAERGFYQQSLDAKYPVQLIRVTVPYSEAVIAEVSGGKHRFSVRLLAIDNMMNQRPIQVTRDIPFDLTICAI